MVEDTHLFTADDGSTLWCGGYTPVDEDGFFCRIAEHRTSDPRCFYCNVAGASYRQKALEDKRVKPRAKVILRPEPTNAHDPHAIGVWDSREKMQLGYVPASLSAKIAAHFAAGNPYGGVIISEFRRGSETGVRIGLHMVIAPLGTLLLSVQSDKEESDRGNDDRGSREG